jgi:outer membrane receptor protein involved in Fe transport
MPIDVFRSATMILGVSYDSFEGLGIDKNVINPKFGFVWNLTSWTTFRAVAFRVLKRPFVSNQTIEPTQIAGFNQFFDDGSGSESKRYGVGLDQQIHRDLFTGIELSWRDVKDVILPQGVPRVEDHNETLYRGYVYWTIHPKLAFSTEYQYEELERDPIFASNRRDKLRTHYVPINFNYHSPNGFFASVGATYASQKINFQETIIQLTNEGPLASQIPRSDSDNFWVVDASIGYRLPKRYGLLSIEVRNLLDQDFEFESTFDIAGEIPHSPRFQPDRTIFARLNLWFY